MGHRARAADRGERASAGHLTALAVLTGLLLAVGGVAAAQESHDVDVADDEFSPATIEIEAGDTVRWSHSGANPHTVTADDGSFDSHPDCPADCMMASDTYEQTFEEPGEYGYHCRLHGSAGAGMAGTVVVAAADETPEPEDDGSDADDRDDAETQEPATGDETTDDPAADEVEAQGDEVAEERLPETGLSALALVVAGLFGLGLGGLWLRRAPRQLS